MGKKEWENLEEKSFLKLKGSLLTKVSKKRENVETTDKKSKADMVKESGGSMGRKLTLQ